MTVTVPPSGSFSALALTGLEQALFDSSVGASYSLTVDLTNMAPGDTIVLRAYLAWTPGGLRNCMLLGGAGGTFSGAQVAPDILKKSIVVIAPYGVKFTVQRTGGAVTGGISGRVDQIGTVSVTQAATQATTNVEVTVGAAVVTGDVIVLLADVSLQGAGASVKLRAKESAISGGVVKEGYNLTTAVGALSDPDKFLQSVAVDAAYSGSFSVIRSGGADFNIPYILCKLAAA